MRWKPNTTPRPLMRAIALSALSLSAWAQSPASPTPVSEASASQTKAQPGDASPASARHEHRMARQQERRNRALTSLAQALQLQAGQQAAWQRFEQAMKARPAPVSGADKASAQDLPAQLARLKAHKAQRDAAFEQRVQATLDLHASLEPKQQQVLAERAGRWLQGHDADRGNRHRMGSRHGGDHHHPQGPVREKMRGHPHAHPA